MRALALAASLTVSLAAAAGPARARAADEPPTLTLVVGEETEDLGVAPRCDDLTIVAVKKSGRGVRGLRPGATTCSFDRSGGGGIRRVYRVVVIAPAPPPSDAPADAPARKG
jgi:hypothetical protein